MSQDVQREDSDICHSFTENYVIYSGVRNAYNYYYYYFNLTEKMQNRRIFVNLMQNFGSYKID